MRSRIKPEWAVAVAYVAAMFVNILDTTIITVALPTLSREFDAGPGTIEWVVTGYLLSLAVWIPASGWIGDRFGTKRTFLVALTIFTVASALCGQAQSLEQLIFFRILQGVGGGMLTPVGFAMLMRAFPPERRAAASRVLIIPTVIAPASGPIIGGFLVDSLSWRWVFYVNLPICIAALIFAAIYLVEHKEPRAGGFDLPGFVLSGGGLAAVLFALGEGPLHGWSAPRTWVPGVLGLVAFVALVRVELRRREPMLQFRLLGDRLFRTVMMVSVFSTGAFLGLLFVLPLFLQNARGLSALDSGLTTFPEALGVLTFSQISGRLYPSVGPRRLMVGGLISMATFLLLLTRVDLETNLWVLRALLFGAGASMSFVFIPLQASAFARISGPDTGRASSIFNAQRQMSAALGVAILATVLSMTLPSAGAGLTPDAFRSEQVGAFHTVFVVGAVMALIGAAIAFFVKDADAAATMRPKIAEPEAEPAEPVAAG